jgi:hypothetical protein
MSAAATRLLRSQERLIRRSAERVMSSQQERGRRTRRPAGLTQSRREPRRITGGPKACHKPLLLVREERRSAYCCADESGIGVIGEWGEKWRRHRKNTSLVYSTMGCSHVAVVPISTRTAGRVVPPRSRNSPAKQMGAQQGLPGPFFTRETPMFLACTSQFFWWWRRDSNLRPRAYEFLAVGFVVSRCSSLLSGFSRRQAKNRDERLPTAGSGSPRTE